LYFISEYCPEGSLYEIIKKEKKGLKEQEVAYIMKQLISVCYFIINYIYFITYL